jgi:predicted MPP superfamily phosphohydrolase
MKKAIIHISDLHITSHLDTDGLINKEIKSFFNTNPKSDEPKSYLDRVLESVKESYSDYEFYLVITGDITEKANTDEFIKAFEFLEYFLKELNIPKSKTLIVPGDHDVNWTDCKVDFEKKRNANQNLTAPECYKAKLSKYKEFIDKFYGDNTFKADNAITRYICFENQLILLGLNSNFKVGTKPALGYIPKDTLKKEVEKLNFDKPIYWSIPP